MLEVQQKNFTIYTALKIKFAPHTTKNPDNDCVKSQNYKILYPLSKHKKETGI